MIDPTRTACTGECDPTTGAFKHGRACPNDIGAASHRPVAQRPSHPPHPVIGAHCTSEAAHQHADQFHETTRDNSIRVVRQVVTTTVEPGGQTEDGAQQ
ncbi:hypothetical protein ACFV0Y_16555 [Streptomyces sp. NPDC059569]|uniref:hypothetical protein n=1 Tax=Streptomyces sp. NPDC059569 TaxID=3346869 RepID=UPI0036A30C87